MPRRVGRGHGSPTDIDERAPDKFEQLPETPNRNTYMAQKSVLRCLVFLFGLSFAAAACSGSDDAGASVIESCSGSYVCNINGDSVDAQLIKSGSACYLGSLELRADGTAPPVAGQSTTWSGDTRQLTICSGDLCFVCRSQGDAKNSAPSASATCTGSATSCSSVGASSCTDQGGCHYTVGSNVSSTSDDGCEGTPRECSDYNGDEKGCGNHRGCTWH